MSSLTGYNLDGFLGYTGIDEMGRKECLKLCCLLHSGLSCQTVGLSCRGPDQSIARPYNTLPAVSAVILENKWKYSHTLMQYPAILPSQPSNNMYIYICECVCIIKGNIFMCHSVDCTTKTCWVVDEVILSVKAFLVMWIAPPAPAVRPLTLFALLTLSKKLLVPLKFSKLAAPQIAPAHT